MCQASIPLRVRYRMPWHQQPAPQAQPEEAAGPGAGAAADGIPGLAALALALQASRGENRQPLRCSAPALAAAKAITAVLLARPRTQPWRQLL